MFQPIRSAFHALSERIPAGSRRRAAAIFLTLLIEGVIVFLLLTLSPSIVRHKEDSLVVFSIDADPDKPASEEPSAPSEQQSQAKEQQQQPEQPATQEPETAQTPPQSAPPPPPWIMLSREQMATADIGAKRPAPPTVARKSMGPPDTGTPGDTPRAAGQGPNGEPLYAAAWYREPYEDELRGYLSTAQGPGWGLIACRTVADYRVEDCVALGENPQGSGITRAVLAAAWQFRVRPPRVGGRSKIGEWVRIRIDYEQRRR